MKIIRKTRYYNDIYIKKINEIFAEFRKRRNIKYYIYSSFDFSVLINYKENKL